MAHKSDWGQKKRWSLVPASEPENNFLTEQTELRLPPEQWEVFCRRLDAPPLNVPALRRLLAEPEPFDA